MGAVLLDKQPPPIFVDPYLVASPAPTSSSEILTALARALLDGEEEAIAVFDRHCRCAFVNKSFCRLCEQAPPHLLGRSPEELFPPRGLEIRHLLERAVRAPAEGRTQPSLPEELGFGRTTRERGRLHATPLHDLETQEVLGLLVRWQPEPARQTFLKTGERASEMERGGTWEALIDEAEVKWSQSAVAFLGLAEGAQPTRSDFLRLLHPDDRLKVQQAWERLQHEGEVLAVECRLLHKQRGEFWISLTGAVRRVGTPPTGRLRIVGALHDVDERIRSQRTLDDAVTMLELALDGGRAGAFSWNVGEEIITWSESLYPLFGFDAGVTQATYALFAQRVHPEDLPQVEAAIAHAVSTGQDYFTEYRARQIDGSWRWLEARARMLRDGPTGRLRMVGVARDIEHWKRLQERLEGLVQETREAHQTKSAVINALSHDIRTPLTALVGLADHLAAHPQSPHATDMAETMRDSATVLLDIVDDLLQLGRLEANPPPLNVIPVDVLGVARRVINILQLRAKEKGLRLELSNPEEVDRCLALVEVRATERILMNLLDNAIKYSDSGTVRLTLECHSDSVRALVDDEGAGIPTSERERIFQPYVRLHQGPAKPRGLGLGLAICAQLTAQMDGRLRVTESPAGGARFILELRPAPESCAEDPASSGATPAPPRRLAKKRSQKPSVLLVEDCKSIRLLVEMMFARTVDLSFATNLQEGRATFARQSYDAILIDLDLGDGASGLELVQELRAEHPHTDCLFVAFTATVVRDEIWFKERGFDTVLRKPFSREDFARAIHLEAV